MSNATSFLAFPDVKSAFERAIATERGIKVSFKTRAEATQFTARCNRFRVLDRAENIKIYKGLETHTLYGRSVYDHLKIVARDSDVFITPSRIEDGSITEL